MSSSNEQEVGKGKVGTYDSPAALTKETTYTGQPQALPVYDSLEMGVHNAAFVHDANSNRASSVMQSRAFSPYAVDTPVPPSYELNETASGTADTAYLKPAPVDGSVGHQYEDLAHMAAKLAESKSGGGPRKKTNVLYEPAELKNGKSNPPFARPSESRNRDSTYEKHASSGNYRRIIFYIFIVGCIAIIALILAILASQGVIGDGKECSCAQATAMKSSGVDTRVDFLMKLVQEMQANLTQLRQQLEPQIIDVTKLKLDSNTQKVSISSIEKRLDTGEIVTNKLNDSIADTKREISVSESNLNGKIAGVSSQLNSTIDSRVARLDATDLALTNFITTVNETLLGKISNISLTPGPAGPAGLPGTNGTQGIQGPKGAGNLTSCRARLVRSTSATISVANAPRAFVTARHTGTDGYITVGGSCSSPNARRTHLEERSTGFYSCRCEELYPTTPSEIQCDLLIWECPKTS